jgi:hypothetical protein
MSQTLLSNSNRIVLDFVLKYRGNLPFQRFVRKLNL